MMLDEIIKAVRYDIIHHNNLQGLFSEVAFGIKEELNYPALLINIADVTPNMWYGYDDITLFFSIINNQGKIETLQILDKLRQNLNYFNGTNNPTSNVRYIIQYEGGFEDTYDFDSKEYIVTTVWRVRGISTI